MQKTTLEQVQEQIRTILDKKQSDLGMIEIELDKAMAAKDEAAAAAERATEQMDLAAFEAATEAGKKAESAIKMFSGRHAQIAGKKYVTEAESDKTISDLLAYEEALAVDFRAALGVALAALRALYDDYRNEIAAVEGTLLTWTREVHPNYLAPSSMFVDPETGLHSHRSKVPVPVHRVTFLGCDEARALGEYLEKSAALLSGEGV